MDLAPFAAIDPCGYPGLAVTQTPRSRHRRAAPTTRRATRGAHRRTHRTPKRIPSMSVTDKQKGAAKTARIPIKVVPQEALKKPDWIRVRAPSPGSRFHEIKQILREQKLHTVCEEASCPNIGECFGKGTATFMILGDMCTRRCPFCDVGHGRPAPPDADEPRQAGADHRRAEALVRGHHQRRPRRPARRRRAAFRRLHPRRARAFAADAHRGAGARLPRPARARAGDPRRVPAGRDEPQPRDRAAAVQAGAPGRRLRAFAETAPRLQGARTRTCRPSRG